MSRYLDTSTKTQVAQIMVHHGVISTPTAHTFFCVCGAVADLCGELARDSSSTGKPPRMIYLESMVIPTEFLTANPISQSDAEVPENLLRE